MINSNTSANKTNKDISKNFSDKSNFKNKLSQDDPQSNKNKNPLTYNKVKNKEEIDEHFSDRMLSVDDLNKKYEGSTISAEYWTYPNKVSKGRSNFSIGKQVSNIDYRFIKTGLKSPDGKSMAIISNKDGNPSGYLFIDLNGINIQKSSKERTKPVVPFKSTYKTDPNSSRDKTSIVKKNKFGGVDADDVHNSVFTENKIKESQLKMLVKAVISEIKNQNKLSKVNEGLSNLVKLVIKEVDEKKNMMKQI